MTDERLLTVPQAAERLGCNEDTVRRWIRTGALEASKPGGDRLGYRIPESAVLAKLKPAAAAA